MSPTHVPPEKTSPSVEGRHSSRLPMIVAADANDVMRDQLEFLIEHAQAGDCGCALCERYFRARTLLLMELFPETQAAFVTKKSASSSAR